MGKIKVNNTQLLLFDLALSTAMRFLFGEFEKIKNASEEELIKMKKDAEENLNNIMTKIKNH